MARSAKAAYSLYLKRGRYYVNLRRLGGACKACVPEGATEATQDRATAERLALLWASELQEQKSASERLGFRSSLALADYGRKQIAAAEQDGTVSPRWAATAREYLANMLFFFERVQPESEGLSAAERRRMASPRNLASIGAPDVVELQEWLAQQPNGRGGTYSPQTVRHHCTVLSGIYRRAIRRGQLGTSYTNPVLAAGLPSIPETETLLMEAEDVALALAAAERVQTEAWAADEPRLSARRVVFVTLAMLAYTGARLDEAMRVDWLDLLESPGGHFLRIHSARKGKNASQVRRVRLVPISPLFADVLARWRRQTGCVVGPILTDPETGTQPCMVKAFAAVERRASLPGGLLGSRTLRVAYASHRAACEGVTWNDVRDELGHASLAMQARVYGRGRLNRESMGPHLDYSLSRWTHLLGDRATKITSSTDTPDRWTMARAERDIVIQTYLAAVQGMGLKMAGKVTGVNRAVVQRLRQGKASDVKSASLERMKTYLRTIEAYAA